MTWFWLGFFQFWFGSVWFFQFFAYKTEPNRPVFSNFNWFFLQFGFFGYFFLFSRFNQFFGFFAYPYGEPYIPHDTMVEMMVKSTSSSSNVCGIVDDNINHYRNMIMNVMRMNHGHASQCSIVDEEPNADATIFFLSFQIF